MMELTYFLQLCVIFFAVLGYLRGFYKEFIGLAGILLSLFFLTEFNWLLDFLIGGLRPGARFYIEATIFILFVFFSYQQAPMTFAPRNYRTARGGLKLPRGWQQSLLGAVFGGLNGYMVVGSLWYMMDQLEYPLSSLFMQPLVGSQSAEFVANLPLVWLQGNNLLIWLVAGLFMLIIIFR